MKSKVIRIAGLLCIAITCIFSQAKAQDPLVIESPNKIIYKKNTSSPNLLTIDTKKGFVGVNTPAPTQALEVNGKVLIRDSEEDLTIGNHPYNLWVTDGVVAEDLFIVDRTGWADYVFEENYALMELKKLEKYIQKNHHLPNIPSQEEVAEEGYSQHNINTSLLEKIEELMLYTIQQEKDIDAQTEIIAEQKQQIKKLLQLVDKLKSDQKY